MSEPVHTINFNIRGREFLTTMHKYDDRPPATVGKLMGFYDIWSSLKKDGKFPKRQDLTFETLKGWHRNIRVVDLGAKTDDPKRNIILGELYKEYWGNDTMISQIMAMGDDGNDAMEGYREFLEYFYKGHYGINIGYSPDRNKRKVKIIWIDLPLSSDGNQIDHLVTALLRFDEK